MNKRTFTPDEINKLLNSLAGNDPYDVGGGFVAIRSARGINPNYKGPPGFLIEINGVNLGRLVEDCTQEELAAISAGLWEKGKEFISDRRDELIPDWMKEKVDPELEARRAKMTPEERRVDDLMPDWMRHEKKEEEAEAALSHADQLIPDEYREKPDPELAARRAAMTPEERHRDDLIPDWIKEQEKKKE
jgi:hypothetical protein